ncbi:MAG: iron chelate uptake ABC transporter family permease subunit, partial [Spirochaetales bacterium]|nr:iron chelate uptake ABC transporter family permease subunit [Spirochaetales bacterium]
DTLGRIVIAPFEIKTGIITSLIGAPYLLYLVITLKRKGFQGFFKRGTLTE